MWALRGQYPASYPALCTAPQCHAWPGLMLVHKAQKVPESSKVHIVNHREVNLNLNEAKVRLMNLMSFMERRKLTTQPIRYKWWRFMLLKNGDVSWRVQPSRWSQVVILYVNQQQNNLFSKTPRSSICLSFNSRASEVKMQWVTYSWSNSSHKCVKRIQNP
jgi:hypothetical protein